MPDSPRSGPLISAPVAIGLLAVLIFAAAVYTSVAAFYLLWMAVPFVIWIDIASMLRRHGQRWSSVDVLWVLAGFMLHIFSLMAWGVVGRRVRYRELQQRRRGPREPLWHDDEVFRG